MSRRVSRYLILSTPILVPVFIWLAMIAVNWNRPNNVLRRQLRDVTRVEFDQNRLCGTVTVLNPEDSYHFARTVEVIEGKPSYLWAGGGHITLRFYHERHLISTLNAGGYSGNYFSAEGWWDAGFPLTQKSKQLLNIFVNRSKIHYNGCDSAESSNNQKAVLGIRTE